MSLDVKKVYEEAGAFLQGHFLLSSGNHSEFYLQSAKVLEDPKTAEKLAKALAQKIEEAGVEVDTVCSPALGGVLAGYELARALGVRFIFTERVDKVMTLRRGFEVAQGEKVLICEDIITTAGSALESAECIKKSGGVIQGFAALANRGFCSIYGSSKERKENCKLPADAKLFALGDFEFEIYEPESCPLCKDGSEAYKPGSRNN